MSKFSARAKEPFDEWCGQVEILIGRSLDVHDVYSAAESFDMLKLPPAAYGIALLIDELAEFCNREGLPRLSANEILPRTNRQAEWLKNFERRWMRTEAAAQAETQTSRR